MFSVLPSKLCFEIASFALHSILPFFLTLLISLLAGISASAKCVFPNENGIATDLHGMAISFYKSGGKGGGFRDFSISTSHGDNGGIFSFASPPLTYRDYSNYQQTVFSTRSASIKTRVNSLFETARGDYNTWTNAEYSGRSAAMRDFDTRYRADLGSLLDAAEIGGPASRKSEFSGRYEPHANARKALFSALEGTKDLPDQVSNTHHARQLELASSIMQLPENLAKLAGMAIMSPWSDAVQALGGYDAYTGDKASRAQGAAMLGVGILSGALGEVAQGGKAMRYLDDVGELGAMGVAKGGVAADGSIYSTAFQTTLKSTSYPGMSRAAHFQEANGALLQAMEGSSEIAGRMQGLGINLERTATGLAPRQSPAGWTWHHAPEPGVMQLVPRAQHAPGSIFQPTLHPSGQGGMATWGR